MVVIKKILIPVDGSEYMKNEITWACELAKTFNSEVTILHVVVMPVSSDIGGIPAASRHLEEAGTKILEDAKQMAEACGISPKIEIDFSVGNPGMRIVRKAETDQTDLIIIGAKGKNRFREILMGSVANTVVNNAKCLVLVVHSCE
jgi:nucleotide-binding universal stress UspA family protein